MAVLEPVGLDGIRAMLAHISANLPRDEWVAVAMAIKSEAGDAGFDVFDEWSRSGEHYKAGDTRSTWRSVKARGGRGIGTLVRMAKAGGWRPPEVHGTKRPAAPIDPATLKAARQAREREAAAERDRIEATQCERAGRARELWAGASDEGASPYLVRKGLAQAHGARYAEGGLLRVPMRDAAGELWNVQNIGPDGAKLYAAGRGGRKAGLFHVIGQDAGAEVLLIGEGFATCATAHEATGRPACVAFDAGNLAAVARALRELHPSALLVMIGDNDHGTEASTGRNPGRDAAERAARAVRGLAVCPPLEVLPPDGTDWNDAAGHVGAATVRDAIEAAIADHLAGPSDRARRGDRGHGQGTPAGSPPDAPGGPPGEPQGRGGFDPFRADADGVWHEEREGGPVRVCGPLHVVALARDAQDNGAALLLEFDTRFRAGRRWLMPLAMLAGDGAAYRAELLSRGFMPPHDAKRRGLLTAYLQSRQPAELVRHTPRVGWHGRCYVLPEETLGEPAGDRVIFHSEAGIEVNFSRRGNLETWRTSIAALCVGNSRMAFAVAAAFAGPLLAWAPIKGGGGFHWVGETSTGKTTGLLAAASVWGKGTENDPESFMQKWRATSNGLEFQGEQHNDCTLILDELGQIEPNEAGPAAYMLADGMGKARSKAGGGLRHKPTWRLLFLSSGELTLAQHMEAAGKKMKGGQEVRLIPLPAEVTPGSCLEELHEFETGHELSESVKRAAAVCYGHAGREWLLWLCENTARLPALLQGHMAAFEAAHVRDESSGQVKRGARRFALVAAAGELANVEAGLTGWPPGEATKAAAAMFRAWIESRAGGLGTSEEATMLRDVRLHFLTCGEMNYKRWGAVDSDHAKATPYMYGWRKPVMSDERNEGGELVSVQVGSVWFVQRDAFESVVCKGHNPRRVLEVLKARDLVIAEPGGRLSHQARPPGESRRGVTVYRIRSDILDATDE